MRCFFVALFFCAILLGVDLWIHFEDPMPRVGWICVGGIIGAGICLILEAALDASREDTEGGT